MGDAIAMAILAGIAMALVAGVLITIARVSRWVTRADVKEEQAQREWEERRRQRPGIEERAAAATWSNPLGNLTWDDIKPMDNAEHTESGKSSSSKYDELSKKVEERTTDIVRTSTAVASGAVRGASAGLPRWLKVLLFIAAGWIVLLLIGALLS